MIPKGKKQVDIIVSGSINGITIDISDSYYQLPSEEITSDIEVVVRLDGRKKCNLNDTNKLSDEQLRQAIRELAKRAGLNTEY